MSDMVNARQTSSSQPGRFNVLLAEGPHRGDGVWASRLAHLLKPQGVSAFVARSGREAIALANEHRIHAAMIDLTTPVGHDHQQHANTKPAAMRWTLPAIKPDQPAGLWLLEVLARMPTRPATIVVNSRLATHREVQRTLNQALRLGAFSVVNQPTELEMLLGVIQRLIDRQHSGRWPQQPQRHDQSPSQDNFGVARGDDQNTV